MSRTKTNRRADREQYIRPNAATVKLITLVKPAETSARDGLNTNDGTHRLSKRQSLSTTVLFRTTFPRRIMLNLVLILTYDGIFDIFLKPNELSESNIPFTRNMLYVKDLIKAIKSPSPSLIKANVF